MKGSRALLVTLAVAAGMLVLLVGLRGPYAHLVAEHLRTQLDTVPDDRASVLLDQVAELGEPGIPVLVEALGSKRESVARAGKRTLLEQLDRWQMLRSRACSPKLAVLADALAGQVGQFGPTARADAADLATQILSWPLDSDAVDRSRVIASCEKVFRAAAVDRRPPAEATMAVGRPSPPTGPDQLNRQPLDTDKLQSGALIAEAARLPGGGLPIDSFPRLDSSEDPLDTPQMADERAAQPRRLAAPPDAHPISVPRQPDPLLIDPHELRALPKPHDAPDRPGREPSLIRPLTLGAVGDLSKAETIDLMRSLHAGDAAAAGSRAELVRRGFSARHIELARRLFDPDPEVRRQLARMLPGLAGVDAVPWLLWLSRDADPDVRLTAITLLATTGDPAMVDQIEQAARQDRDPRIRRQAQRIGSQPNRRK